MPTRSGVERWCHPEAGDLTLSFETLDVPEYEGLRIVTYLPADARTAEALTRLSHTGPLRLVRTSGE
ncbi:hypothetical protein ACFQV2_02060 [Actinokineospora soli]|uniref:MmyB-like transcription regulator ligand binding domain-containing protein n=1 Tax=Actinokineospora soli TaxID=1048753 RepID=A0ABW2TFX9_9PSEU